MQTFVKLQEAIPFKLQAGEYMLERVPVRWRSILAEGLALRRGERSGYRSRLARAREVVGFVGYAIQECNNRFAGTVPNP
jgi:hypothetical protein